MKNVYMCIDLKSFYASVECVKRGLDPLKARLVVADESRGRGAICLAVSPALKAMGIRNRCRLFEIGEGIDYICAMPSMRKYMEASANIYEIYLKYVASEDIHVYSIDECFLDVTKYLKLYGISAYDLAKRIIDDVLKTTHIPATAGIGNNLFLAKVALDVISKHAADNIGMLDEVSFKENIWHLRPITDIWGISVGTRNRLEKYGIYDLYGVTQADEKMLYDEFGVNAEILIDHANGVEPCTMKDIKAYKPKSSSLSTNQILFEDYKYEDAIIILKEMVDTMCLELVEKGICAKSIGLSVGYSEKQYTDYKPSVGASKKLVGYTNSKEKIMPIFLSLFEQKVDKSKLIRRIGIGFGDLEREEFASIDLFTDIEKEKKEKRMQDAIISIRNRFGKNACLKAIDLEEKATAKKRNSLIGGHNA